jgi:hypothetical protein
LPYDVLGPAFDDVFIAEVARQELASKCSQICATSCVRFS